MLLAASSREQREARRVRGRTISIGLLAVVLAVASGCGPAYRAHENLVYDPSIGAAGLFDLYVPPGEEKFTPAVVVIHGGAFHSEDKSWARSFAGEIATQGYTVLAINYREAPDAHWPAPLEDCRSAVRFFRAHGAELGLDPGRIATLGVSSGGCLASLLALEDDPRADPAHAHVEVFVDVAGESDFSLPDAFPNQPRILTDLFGAPPPWPGDLLREVSPIDHGRSDVSALIVHGVSDPMMNVDQSDRFAAALRAAGARVTYLRRDSSEHSDTLDTGHVRDTVVAFLDACFYALPPQ